MSFVARKLISHSSKLVNLSCKSVKSHVLPKPNFLQPQILSSNTFRSMFIQTQDTPNPASLKFLPGTKVSLFDEFTKQIQDSRQSPLKLNVGFTKEFFDLTGNSLPPCMPRHAIFSSNQFRIKFFTHSVEMA